MSFISASGLPLIVSSIEVTGSAEVQGDLAVDKHFYQRDSAGGVVIEDDIVIGSARYDQLVGAPNTTKVFRTTNGASVAIDRLYINTAGIEVPAGTIIMTDSQAVPLTTRNDRFVFGSGIYDENNNINNSLHVFRDTDGAGVSTASLTLDKTSAIFSGVVSTANAPVAPLGAWATDVAVPDGVNTIFYTSPQLANGVYLVQAQCAVTSNANPFNTLFANFKDENGSNMSSQYSFASPTTYWTLHWSYYYTVSSPADDFFELSLQGETVGNTDFTLFASTLGGDNGVGYVKYMKIA
jgi:hypothetical protein